jgi:hypothetical protein
MSKVITHDDLKFFDRFSDKETCIVCGTNDDKPCVLIQVDGTRDGNIAEAIPVHVQCAIPSGYSREAGLLYRRTRL